MERSERGCLFHYPAALLPFWSWRWSLADPLVVAIALGGFVVWLWFYRHAQRRVPGPKSWPVIGSTIEIVRNWHRLHDWFLEMFSNEARSLQVAFAFPVVGGVYTVDPANVEHILKTNFANYPKGLSNCTPMRELFGVGIFATDGEMWKEQRRTASYEFSSATLRDFSTVVFRDYACKLVSLLAQFASTGAAFDLQDLCMRMTLDSTSQIGFGVKLDCLSPELRSIAFAHCFDEANYISFYRFCDPLWKIKRRLNVGRERRLKECVQVLDDFSFDVIERRRKQMGTSTGASSSNLTTHSDLLSRFIDLCNRDSDGGNPNSKPLFTDRALRDMILNFIIAGRDTTAVTLSWFFYLTTRHPHVAQKIVVELAAVVTPHDPRSAPETTHHPEVADSIVDEFDTDSQSAPENAAEEFAKLLTFERLGKLHYLHAALSETLRLYPAVPVDSKEAAADDVLPDGTVVKKGTFTGYVPFSMGRMPFLWGDDAAAFRPERWLGEDGHFQAQPLFKFTAFQAGPRTCLGKDSAYLQMKMTAALVLRFFELHLVPDHPVRYRTMLVIAMQHGLRVTATPRPS